MKKEWVIILALLALFGNGFLFFCVALPGWLNQGYFAGDLDRYGEMIFEVPLMCFTFLLSIGFVGKSIVEGLQ